MTPVQMVLFYGTNKLTMQENWKSFLYFSKSERNGILLLSILLILGIFTPNLYRWRYPTQAEDWIIKAWNPPINNNSTSTNRTFANANKPAKPPHQQSLSKPSSSPTSPSSPVTPPLSLFPFDPNKADSTTLQQLGLPTRVIKTLLKFRAKGGQFRKAEDLQKIYGLSTSKFEELKPYIQIPQKPIASKSSPKPKPRTNKVNITIDINKATPSDWQKLYGIGPAFSKRIVKFRDKLGGFYSIEQVGQTYGLPDSTFQKIAPQLRLSPIFRKLAINTATIKELAQHPYINYKLAKILCNFRDQHGPFKDLADLSKVAAIEPQQLEQLGPYIDFKP